jgi:hypothetical protein
MDPAYETDGNSFMVCDNIFEALVFYKPTNPPLWSPVWPNPGTISDGRQDLHLQAAQGRQVP